MHPIDTAKIVRHAAAYLSRDEPDRQLTEDEKTTIQALMDAAATLERLDRFYELVPFTWHNHKFFNNEIMCETPLGVYTVTQERNKYLAALDRKPISERDYMADAQEDCFLNFKTQLRPHLGYMSPNLQGS